MPRPPRLKPEIPDHEVLRKIGGGAYGEVWLARGVTGAMRAVKIVSREDFEDARTFEREFEGILRFEPISRDHPGLVNVLHVGRSPDKTSFYYYVMELADDVTRGRDIHPVEYEPKTLRADHQTPANAQKPTDQCIEIGLRLAEALDHLHSKGLAHRDIKPSNVIFVGGKAKLADIGLVAARGQRTFVGTEGFVPPEGPGTEEADIYSLGKVLYEIVTGKDRLDFPELPDELPQGDERRRWQALNHIICEVCEPTLSKRSIRTAAELAEQLRRLQSGRRIINKKTRIRGMLVGIACLAILTCFIYPPSRDFITQFFQNHDKPIPVGQVKFFSSPTGAEIMDNAGNIIGFTPSRVLEYPAGTVLNVSLRKDGYRLFPIEHTIRAGEIAALGDELVVYNPPVIGKPWTDHLNMPYRAEGNQHISLHYVSEDTWKKFTQATKKNSDEKSIAVAKEGNQNIILTTPELTNAFCQWFQKNAAPSYLSEDQEVMSLIDGKYKNESAHNLKPFHIVVRNVPYAEISIVAEPLGVEVALDNAPKGYTNPSLTLEKVHPGKHSITFSMAGYKPQTSQIILKENEKISLNVVLKENKSVVFGKSWTNSLDMPFQPIGATLMAAAYETRVSDYATYVKATKSLPPKKPGFPQTQDHPVVNVSRDDAIKFCKWLTDYERKNERISYEQEYRLPTDSEWSHMAGIINEIGDTPAQREMQTPPVYAWGRKDVFPPPDGSGNLSDISVAKIEKNYIHNYNDHFENTAPVGSYVPNNFQLYDIIGNVYEFVSDDLSRSSKKLAVLRGGGWNSYEPGTLYLNYRLPAGLNIKDVLYGFRVVIAPVKASQ